MAQQDPITSPRHITQHPTDPPRPFNAACKASATTDLHATPTWRATPCHTPTHHHTKTPPPPTRHIANVVQHPRPPCYPDTARNTPPHADSPSHQDPATADLPRHQHSTQHPGPPHYPDMGKLAYLFSLYLLENSSEVSFRNLTRIFD
ncbi:hypothetical protein EDB83DRAFT_2315732 [Lactarius deliciosus]|nr:hypothetical protein EDB83DRAFT_2315732 [Lactarius deliciosus]